MEENIKKKPYGTFFKEGGGNNNGGKSNNGERPVFKNSSGKMNNFNSSSNVSTTTPNNPLYGADLDSIRNTNTEYTAKAKFSNNTNNFSNSYSGGFHQNKDREYNSNNNNSNRDFNNRDRKPYGNNYQSQRNPNDEKENALKSVNNFGSLIKNTNVENEKIKAPLRDYNEIDVNQDKYKRPKDELVRPTFKNSNLENVEKSNFKELDTQGYLYLKKLQESDTVTTEIAYSDKVNKEDKEQKNYKKRNFNNSHNNKFYDKNNSEINKNDQFDGEKPNFENKSHRDRDPHQEFIDNEEPVEGGEEKYENNYKNKYNENSSRYNNFNDENSTNDSYNYKPKKKPFSNTYHNRNYREEDIWKIATGEEGSVETTSNVENKEQMNNNNNLKPKKNNSKRFWIY